MSQSTHRIRLGPPWDESPGGTHARRFGRPRTLADGEQVWLVCQLPDGATVAVNGTAVPPAADITSLLRARNEVVIQLRPEESRGEVAIEIRSGA